MLCTLRKQLRIVTCHKSPQETTHQLTTLKRHDKRALLFNCFSKSWFANNCKLSQHFFQENNLSVHPLHTNVVCNNINFLVFKASDQHMPFFSFKVILKRKQTSVFAFDLNKDGSWMDLSYYYLTELLHFYKTYNFHSTVSTWTSKYVMTAWDWGRVHAQTDSSQSFSKLRL